MDGGVGERRPVVPVGVSDVASVAAQGPNDHGVRAEVDRNHESRVGRRLDRFGRCQGMAVDGLHERQLLRTADRRPGRNAGPTHDALTAADDEVALELDAVGAMVPGGHVADDVVVREGVGRVALRGVDCGAST